MVLPGVEQVLQGSSKGWGIMPLNLTQWKRVDQALRNRSFEEKKLVGLKPKFSESTRDSGERGKRVRKIL